jgi:hypothetical protein
LEVSDQLHVPAALPRGKAPQYPLDSRLGGPPELVWVMWRKENSLDYRDLNSNPRSSSPQIEAYNTTKYRLRPIFINFISINNVNQEVNK